MEHYRLVTLQRYSYEAITFCLSGKKYLPGCSNNNFLILIPTSQIFMILLFLQVVICLMLRKTLSLVSYVQVRVVLLSLLSSSIALLCSVYLLISVISSSHGLVVFAIMLYCYATLVLLLLIFASIQLLNSLPQLAWE
jgi:hypothetical protein